MTGGSKREGEGGKGEAWKGREGGRKREGKEG